MELLACGVNLGAEGVNRLLGRHQGCVRARECALGVGGGRLELDKRQAPILPLLEPLAMLRGQGNRFLLELGNLVLEGFRGVSGEFDRLVGPLQPIVRRPEPGGHVGFLDLRVDPSLPRGFLLRFELGQGRPGGAQRLVLAGAGKFAIAERGAHLGEPAGGLGDPFVETAQLALGVVPFAGQRDQQAIGVVPGHRGLAFPFPGLFEHGLRLGRVPLHLGQAFASRGQPADDGSELGILVLDVLSQPHEIGAAADRA